MSSTHIDIRYEPLPGGISLVAYNSSGREILREDVDFHGGIDPYKLDLTYDSFKDRARSLERPHIDVGGKKVTMTGMEKWHEFRFTDPSGENSVWGNVDFDDVDHDEVMRALQNVVWTLEGAGWDVWVQSG